MIFADQRRMDIVVSVDSIIYALDVTIVSPTLSTSTSSAVTVAAALKRQKYEDDCNIMGMRFIPAALDMYGNICQDFNDFVKKVLAISSRTCPHLLHSNVAAFSRIAICHQSAVGILLASRLAGKQATLD